MIECSADGYKGSPPRMRGKAALQAQIEKEKRITPAYAGKSPVGRGYYHDAEDHPRVCGEKIIGLEHKALLSGSPPRMRGKETDGAVLGAFFGITPAYAGKRSSLDNG